MVFQRNELVSWTDLGDDEIVCLNLQSGRYTGITGVGQIVWRELEEPRTIEDLVGKVVETCEVDAETARQDVESFLAQLTVVELVAERTSDSLPSSKET